MVELGDFLTGIGGVVEYIAFLHLMYALVGLELRSCFPVNPRTLLGACPPEPARHFSAPRGRGSPAMPSTISAARLSSSWYSPTWAPAAQGRRRLSKHWASMPLNSRAGKTLPPPSTTWLRQVGTTASPQSRHPRPAPRPHPVPSARPHRRVVVNSARPRGGASRVEKAKAALSVLGTRERREPATRVFVDTGYPRVCGHGAGASNAEKARHRGRLRQALNALRVLWHAESAFRASSGEGVVCRKFEVPRAAPPVVESQGVGVSRAEKRCRQWPVRRVTSRPSVLETQSRRYGAGSMQW